MNIRFSPRGLMTAANSFVKNHGHELFAAIGVSSFVTAVILAAKAAPIAQKDICKAEEEKGEPLTKMETIKVAGKHYIPTIVAATCGTACVISSTVLENRKVAAVATLCQLTEDNLHDLKTHVVESIGEKKAANIVEETAAKKISDKPAPDEESIPMKYGESLFYDPWHGKYFGCTRDRVEKAVNAVNLRLTGCDFVSLNEFYDELGIPNTNFGNYSGWTSRLGENLRMTYGYGPVPDGRSCAVLDYTVYLEDSIRKMPGVSEVLL